MVSRRDTLKSAAAVLASPLLGFAHAAAAAPSATSSLDDSLTRFAVSVKPRSAWVSPKAAAPPSMPVESKVHVLLVHHSDSSNSYRADQVAGLIRGFAAFHTGPEKKWPDVAYNFFIDRFGGIWEGRAGSLTQPIAGSATGGNQGFSQLVCLIGSFATQSPSAEMQRSLTKLLAGLGHHYGVTAEPEATTTFVSRGSNRWKAGKSVTTRGIEGHRAMSMTSCPGDAAFSMLPQLRLSVQKLRS